MSRGNCRYSMRMIGLALVSAGLALLVALFERHGLVPGPARPFVALIPVVPLIGFFVGIGRWLQHLDELERLIHLEAMILQFAATGILVMSYGMLAKAGAVPDFRATRLFPYLWMAIFGFWGIGIAVVRRKYR